MAVTLPRVENEGKIKHLEPSLGKCQHLEVRKKKMNQKETRSSRQKGRKEEVCVIHHKRQGKRVS